MAKVEILILSNGVWETLEVQQDVIGFGLQYSVDDIRTPEKRNSSYSKTIKVVGSKRNNIIMGHLYDIHSDFSYFNPNNKSSAKILIDSTTVLDGFLQLKSINKLANVDQQGNKIVYNVTVFDDNIDFFSELGEKKLTDLDVSQYDHIYGREKIMDSWTNQWSAGYVYPMLENGNMTQPIIGYVAEPDYYTEDFKPAFYHKWLLHKCAEESGFSLGGTFLDDDIYKKEIIPYSGETYPLVDSDLLNREYNAGIVTDFDVISTSSVFRFNHEGYLNFNDDFTLPYFDNSSNFSYDNALAFPPAQMNGNLYSRWKATKSGKYNFKTKLKITLTLTPQFNSTLQVASSSGGTYVNGNINAKVNLADELVSVSGTTIVVNSIDSNIVPMPTSTTSGVPFIMDFYMTLNTTDVTLITGDIIRQFITIKSVAATGNDIYFRYMAGSIDSFTTDIAIRKVYGAGEESNTLNNTIATDITDGDIVDINNSLPKDFKQKDLFIDVIRRYNLYISIDENDNRKILLNTRDMYYENADILNWSNKKDYSSPDNIKFLTELQNKETLFTYKNDTSAVINNGRKILDDYTKRTGDIYGQHTIEYNNDFINGTKKIESPFSPTMILYQDKTGTFVPAINSKKPKCKPRILLYNGLVNCESGNDWLFKRDNGGVVEFYTHTTYPQALHYDNPINPDVDINFGQSPYEEYSQIENSTDNNLYNRYWKNFTEQVDDGKMVTSMFDLNEYDINKIRNKFNYKILIENAGIATYYFINKIIDYNPINNLLTKVELLKIKDGVTFEPSGGLVIIDAEVADVKGDGGAVDTAGNTGGNVIISQVSIVNGKSNIVNDSEGAIVNGNKNIVESGVKSAYIQGDNNIVKAGVKNAFIVGDNKIIIEDNEIWIGDTHIIDGHFISNINKINGGIDELRYLFSTNNVNVINGGIDELRTDVSSNTENILIGGIN